MYLDKRVGWGVCSKMIPESIRDQNQWLITTGKGFHNRYELSETLLNDTDGWALDKKKDEYNLMYKKLKDGEI